jgi:uncharacterized protein YgiM (DUF1202 family)
MSHDGSHDHGHRTGLALDRRVIMKAAAGFATIAAAGGVSNLRPAFAQDATSNTLSDTYTVGEFSAAATEEWTAFEANFPFYALGVSWPGDVGTDVQVDVQLSPDDWNWSESTIMTANTEDGGRENRDGRLFTDLLFTSGASFVRYRMQDSAGNPVIIAGLQFHYIDAEDGPSEEELTGFSAAAEDTSVSPPIVSRSMWGADESLMTWDPEYQTVETVIIHHSASHVGVTNWASAVRGVYYYHAVTQGWGDIGYNYIVSPTGTIYEGRYGGQNVIGGHAYQYADGSSGICLMGDFNKQAVPSAGLSAIVAITAWVARDLDPTGTNTFHEIIQLPVIASHRDVVSSSCPGENLWADLPEIRQAVAATLDSGQMETRNPGGVVIGDRVTATTDDGQALNVRSTANGTVKGKVNDGTAGWVIAGPTVGTSGNWFQVEFPQITGWVSATYLTITPPEPPDYDDTFYFGVNITINSTSYVRDKPSTSSANLGSAPKNTKGFILAGPARGSGYDWYQVAFPNNVVSDGWVTKQVLTVSPVVNNPSGAKFSVPAYVQTTSTTNVRVRPGISQTIQTTIPAGTRLRLSVAPKQIDGYIFYGAFGSFGGGWVVQDSLRADPNTPTGKFRTGDWVRATAGVNLRRGAGLNNSVLRAVRTDEVAQITGGPSAASGYNWYLMRFTNGSTGWSIQDFFEKTTAPGGTTPAPGTGKFKVNDTFRVTESVNLRSAASTSASVLATLPANSTGTVIGGPTVANGYTWWRVQTSRGTGWAVENWLEKTSSGTTTPAPGTTTTAAPTGKFKINDAIRVTETLNLRTSASTSAIVVAVLPAGTTGTVIGGPTVASGYTWWNIRTSRGTGWAVETWLAKGSTSGTTTSAPVGKFSIGQGIRVTESMRLHCPRRTVERQRIYVVAHPDTGRNGLGRRKLAGGTNVIVERQPLGRKHGPGFRRQPEPSIIGQYHGRRDRCAAGWRERHDCRWPDDRWRIHLVPGAIVGGHRLGRRAVHPRVVIRFR